MYPSLDIIHKEKNFSFKPLQEALKALPGKSKLKAAFH
jgi:hypothetical protein